jgi:RNA polymerase sigma factor (sigma-70 family)
MKRKERSIIKNIEKNIKTTIRNITIITERLMPKGKIVSRFAVAHSKMSEHHIDVNLNCKLSTCIIDKITEKYANRDNRMYFDEIRCIVRESYWLAMKTYDPQRGPFTTYANYVCTREVWRYTRDNKKHDNLLPYSVFDCKMNTDDIESAEYKSNSGKYFNIKDNEENSILNKITVNSILNKVPAKYRKVLVLYSKTKNIHEMSKRMKCYYSSAESRLQEALEVARQVAS